MKSYIEEIIEIVEKQVDIQECPETYVVIQNAREIIDDPKFIEQKGTRSLIDQDARVGRKSKTESFFGYKTELAIVTEEKL